MILFQSPLSFRDLETIFARKYPSISFLETDTAIALSDSSDLRHFDGEFEGAAMAIAMVGL